MLPSTRLVCWSSSRQAMPASASSASIQDSRTRSLVRSNSFIGGPLVIGDAGGHGPVLDRAPPHSMLARLRARQARPPRAITWRRRYAHRGVIVAPAQPSIDRAPERQAASLDALFRLMSADLQRVNALIVERMHSPVALIPQLAGHIVSAGGKRLRPMLTLAAARLCGYQGERHIALAAAVEFIHTATLLHDDVGDTSELRRGRDTANAVWGNKPAVLVGDFLFARSFELMVEDGSLPILEIPAHAASVI